MTLAEMALLSIVGDRIDRRAPHRLVMGLARVWRAKHGASPAILNLTQDQGIGATIASLVSLDAMSKRMSRELPPLPRPRYPDVGIVSVGSVDAAEDPDATTWLDSSESMLRTYSALCTHVVLVVPAPIIPGGSRSGRWSRGSSWRWSRRIPKRLPERITDLVDAQRVTVISADPEWDRADDIWLSTSGVDALLQALSVVL